MGANAANAGITPGGSGGFDAQAAARAGTGGGLSLYHPAFSSGDGMAMSTPQGESFADIKAGFANKRAAMKAQQALAEQVRQDASKPYKSNSDLAINKDDYKAGNISYTPIEGGVGVGVLPQGYNPDTAETVAWKGGKYNFEGIDKGWEDYEKEWQDRYSMDRFGPGSFSTDEGWMNDYQIANFANMEKGMNLGYGDKKIVHSLNDPIHGRMDPRDPTGYGSDYGQWYNSVYGKGALEAEAEKYARGISSGDPAFANYEKGYGKIDWNDMDQVEDWFRRANYGGSRTAAWQDMVAQNKRTDMTEAGIMTALSMGMGALAAPAGASMMASTMTPQQMAISGISNMGQYG